MKRRGTGDCGPPFSCAGELLRVFLPLEEHQGYPGQLYGGIVSAILDETIGRATIIGNVSSQ